MQIDSPNIKGQLGIRSFQTNTSDNPRYFLIENSNGWMGLGGAPPKQISPDNAFIIYSNADFKAKGNMGSIGFPDATKNLGKIIITINVLNGGTLNIIKLRSFDDYIGGIGTGQLAIGGVQTPQAAKYLNPGACYIWISDGIDWRAISQTIA